MKATCLTLWDEPARQRVLSHIANLNIERPWDITIGRHVKKRSLSQNALMWAWINRVVEEVSDYTGMDADKVHEHFKAKFLTSEMIEMGGETTEYRSTKNLSTAEMADYMNRIYAFCTTELGLLLPVPELMDGPATPRLPDQGDGG